MEHKDLFSGIGGFALAARMVWGEQQKPRLFCEKEPYARRVLHKNFPGVPCVEDIRDLRGDPHVTTDLVTAGFPCQPFSVAGKRAGQQDDRYLWPETLRFIHEDRPRWFIGENVPGIINLALDDVLASLEGEGYATETFIIPACAVNAPHRRDRIWIVGNSQRKQWEQSSLQKRWKDLDWEILDHAKWQKMPNEIERPSKKVSYSNKQHGHNGGFRAGKISQQQTTGIPIGQQWELEPGVCGVADGVSHRVDRLRGLGNAIVPHVAAVLMAGIKEVDRVYNNVLHLTQKDGRENPLLN